MIRPIEATQEKVGGPVPPGREELELLEVLKRAADEPEFLARLTRDSQEALKEYYSLTPEERAALASGDIRRIEAWVGKLDKELATWLWCRLSQESW
ncbi:MAG: hypothetical protein KAX25_02720 [Dehalococcoidia bacterium]|nr:hypothetical protein [Chloroflexota bacterium]MCK4221757.1 hypothetical protein [Dehalococcoidia bacterium]MCK4262594.1 hypothetical protein [Dehalococcoidia bacterium]MCK4581037.1 hypothetical protein [Dehalococcoidia bacterium]